MSPSHISRIEASSKIWVHEPLAETRNRKLLRPNPIAPWELRIGDLRVFYEAVSEDLDVVRVLAVGRKEGSKLIIARLEVELESKR